MITNALKKHSSLCWECEWAAGKDEKCPWANKFEPVPGWKAIPTKVLNQSENKQKGRKASFLDSFDVCECPLFELMHEIKEGLVKNSGKVRNGKLRQEEMAEVLEAVKKLRFEDGKTAKEIASKIGYDERSIYRIFKRIKEGENK